VNKTESILPAFINFKLLNQQRNRTRTRAEEIKSKEGTGNEIKLDLRLLITSFS
jgi:hypothetical protein